MNYIKKVLISLTLVAGLLAPLSVAAPAYAEDPAGTGARAEACKALGGSGCDGGDTQVAKVIATAINILSAIGGLIAVIMIIIGGIKYITSGGDSNSVSSAKNTILYAIVGLIVVAFAQVIVQFVLERV